jgi:hypothetical protein
MKKKNKGAEKRQERVRIGQDLSGLAFSILTKKGHS